MSWSIFPKSPKQYFALDEKTENPTEAFNKLFYFFDLADDKTIIRGRSKSASSVTDKNTAPGELRYLYTRSGNPIRQFFQWMLDWTRGAKNSRVEAKNIINGVIDKINLKNYYSKKIILNIKNSIADIDKDFDTKNLKENLKKLKKIIEEENFLNKNSEIIENIDKKSGFSKQDSIINSEQSKIRPVDEKNSSKESQEESEIAVEKFIALSTSQKETIKNADTHPASPAEKRFGGLLAINPNERVTAGRPLNAIYADAYLFSGNTPDPSFENAGPIEKKTELKNEYVRKFEQLINYETRSFLKLHLKSPLKANDPLVTTLDEKNQLDYLNALQDIYQESFELLVKEFAEDKKPLESIALVPISQGRLLVDIEAQALAGAVQKFSKDHPGILIQIVTDSARKKARIENALNATT